MKDQQGFIPVILAILVPVVLVGGYFFYRSMKPEPIEQPLLRPISNLEQPAQPVLTADEQQAADIGETTVTITGSSVSPLILTVVKGTRVTFTNRDTKAHTLISTQLELDPEESLDPEGSITYTFDTVGTFVYSDQDNPNLKGTVIVK